MAGKRSTKAPARPRMVQKRTGSAGAPRTDPGPRKASEASQSGSKAGPVVPGPTGDASAAAKRGSQVPLRRPGLREKTPGDPSIFDRADAGNRRLGRRNRT